MGAMQPAGRSHTFQVVMTILVVLVGVPVVTAIPSFEHTFDEMGVQLPRLTTFVLAVPLVVHYLVLFAILGFAFLNRRYTRDEAAYRLICLLIFLLLVLTCGFYVLSLGLPLATMVSSVGP